MDQFLPTFSQIIASSTANTQALFVYMTPAIWIPFSVAVVIASITLVVRIVHWFSDKVAEIGESRRFESAKKGWEAHGYGLSDDPRYK